MVSTDWLAPRLERVYDRWHDPRYISPDPLEVVREYASAPEREVAGFICACLALGRVTSIIGACRDLLGRIGEPTSLKWRTRRDIEQRCAGFVYRFFDCAEIVRFLSSIGDVLRAYGSLEGAFASGLGSLSGADISCGPETRRANSPPVIAPARRGLIALVGALRECPDPPVSIILSDPARSSAAKRLHLFLRWMVRRDSIDPGGWSALSPADLLVPVDVHMHRIARRLGMTERKGLDLKCSEQISRALAQIDGEDPVRFDFSLTRTGIHPDGRIEIIDEIPLKRSSEDGENERQDGEKVLG